jgi:hypothetical protein
MKYLDFLFALNILYKYYPKYHSSDILLLADDLWKWINNELPEDSSTLAYLKSCFDSPADGIRAIWKELQLLVGPFTNIN